MEQELYQILLTGGAVSLFFILYMIVKVIFGKKKNGNYDQKMLDEVRLLNQNHLSTIDKTLNDGFDRVAKCITDMHKDMAKELGEIKGIISRIK